MNTKALTSAAIAGLIRAQVSDVNMVSAPIMAKERGILLSESKRDKSGVFDRLYQDPDCQDRKSDPVDGRNRFFGWQAAFHSDQGHQS